MDAAASRIAHCSAGQPGRGTGRRSASHSHHECRRTLAAIRRALDRAAAGRDCSPPIVPTPRWSRKIPVRPGTRYRSPDASGFTDGSRGGSAGENRRPPDSSRRSTFRFSPCAARHPPEQRFSLQSAFPAHECRGTGRQPVGGMERGGTAALPGKGAPFATSVSPRIGVSRPRSGYRARLVPCACRAHCALRSGRRRSTDREYDTAALRPACRLCAGSGSRVDADAA